MFLTLKCNYDFVADCAHPSDCVHLYVGGENNTPTHSFDNINATFHTNLKNNIVLNGAFLNARVPIFYEAKPLAGHQYHDHRNSSRKTKSLINWITVPKDSNLVYFILDYPFEFPSDSVILSKSKFELFQAK